MLGFAVLDRRDTTVALWLVSHTEPNAADSTNAVVLDLDQPQARAQLHALTRDRVVVLTPGSVADDLPLTRPHPTALVAEFIEATARHQQAIVDAVRSYAAPRKGQKLVEPTFPEQVQVPMSWPSTPEHRALELAQTVARAWTVWLLSDVERQRRTVQPKTGTTPWIMPEALNQPGPMVLPAELAPSLQPEPLESFPG